jgi:hypothetical protein
MTERPQLRGSTPELPALVPPALDRYGNEVSMQTTSMARAQAEQRRTAASGVAERAPWRSDAAWVREPAARGGVGAGKQGHPAAAAAPSIDAEARHYQSFAVYCEVKLREAVAQNAASSNGTPDPRAVITCFDLLDKMAEEGAGSLARPLLGITAALKEAVYCDDRVLGGGQAAGGAAAVAQARKTYFTKVHELEVEADRVRRNTSHLYGTLQAQQGGRGGDGGRGVESRGGGGAQAGRGSGTGDGGGTGTGKGGKAQLMTESRLMHLETEMNHLISRVETGEEVAADLRRKLVQKERELIDLQRHMLPSLKFELQSAQTDLDRVEASERAAVQELQAMRFKEAELGFSAQDARTQLDRLRQENTALQGKVAKAEGTVKAREEQETRLSFRVQELKKAMLQMVPKAEVTETWSELAAAKEQTTRLERELALLREKQKELEGNSSEFDDMIHFMTPRPDWSKVDQYTSGDVEGKTTTELVLQLYRTIDEARGLTDEASWEVATDNFVALGKGAEVPDFLQWDGTVRNAHFSMAVVDALAFGEQSPLPSTDKNAPRSTDTPPPPRSDRCLN